MEIGERFNWAGQIPYSSGKFKPNEDPPVAIGTSTSFNMLGDQCRNVGHMFIRHMSAGEPSIPFGSIVQVLYVTFEEFERVRI